MNCASLDKQYTCGSGRDMRSSNLPTTGFLTMLFKRLPYNIFYWTHTGHNGLSDSLPETQVNRANCQNISVVKNGNFMRNKGPVFFLCPNIYGQQKYPVMNVSGNIGYIK